MRRKCTGAGTIGAFNQVNTTPRKLLEINGNFPMEGAFRLCGRLLLAFHLLVFRRLFRFRRRCLARLFLIDQVGLGRTFRRCVLVIDAWPCTINNREQYRDEA